MIPQNTYCSIYSLKKKKNCAAIFFPPGSVYAKLPFCHRLHPVWLGHALTINPKATVTARLRQIPALCEDSSLNRGRGARGVKSSASGLEGLLAMEDKKKPYPFDSPRCM